MKNIIKKYKIMEKNYNYSDALFAATNRAINNIRKGKMCGYTKISDNYRLTYECLGTGIDDTIDFTIKEKYEDGWFDITTCLSNRRSMNVVFDSTLNADFKNYIEGKEMNARPSVTEQMIDVMWENTIMYEIGAVYYEDGEKVGYCNFDTRNYNINSEKLKTNILNKYENGGYIEGYCLEDLQISINNEGKALVAWRLKEIKED